MSTKEAERFGDHFAHAVKARLPKRLQAPGKADEMNRRFLMPEKPDQRNDGTGNPVDRRSRRGAENAHVSPADQGKIQEPCWKCRQTA